MTPLHLTPHMGQGKRILGGDHPTPNLSSIQPRKVSWLSLAPSTGRFSRRTRQPPEHPQYGQTWLDPIHLPPSWARTKVPFCDCHHGLNCSHPCRPCQLLPIFPGLALALFFAWRYLSLQNEQNNKLFTQGPHSAERIHATFSKTWPQSRSYLLNLGALVGAAGAQGISAWS